MSPDKAQQIGNDLACLAASIAEIAEEIKALYDSDQSAPVSQAETPEPKELTLEDVRRVLITKADEGFREQVQALIHKRGVERLSKIAPVDYAALVMEAGALK